ncbi:protein PAM68, chloroplastic [Rutidosis leptorrhynchoides]|uniref:protein PAM68, chloroplastic n=1 Tax=Rutidosis leptorrhynchoides TaxID=125765 RepID=UPI003A998B50
MEATTCYSFHLSPSPNNFSRLSIPIPIPFHKIHRNRQFKLSPISATLNSPKGFGPPPSKKITKKPMNPKKLNNNEEEDYEDEEIEREAGVIPEVVTNRMMGRIGLSVGIPLFTGLLFFPFFYYLKVGLKIDVPTWIPFIVSFVFFGTALAGVSYGIVSTSWDPMREGSLLGWNEAQKNWPVFWQSLWGSSGSRKRF